MAGAPRWIWLLALASSAAAADPGELRAGAQVAVLMREEVGGQRTPLPALIARGSYGLWRHLDLSAAYTFALAMDGTAVHGVTQHHRLLLAPEGTLAVGRAEFSLCAGPQLALVSTALWTSDASVSSQYFRLQLDGGLALSVPLGKARARASVDVAWSPSRTDVLIGLGATFDLGGVR